MLANSYGLTFAKTQLIILRHWPCVLYVASTYWDEEMGKTILDSLDTNLP